MVQATPGQNSPTEPIRGNEDTKTEVLDAKRVSRRITTDRIHDAEVGKTPS